jgi:DNA invertase Pin-like site-specific DNA recombinase
LYSAKLDRLARNVALIANLMDGKVNFVCCDMPQANRLTIHVLAAVAEHEREMISDRTKAGLAAAKARGVKLGGPRLAAINETRRVDSIVRAQAIAPILSELASMSARAAAAELNDRKIETPSGAPWSAKTVIRARARPSRPLGINQVGVL